MTRPLRHTLRPLGRLELSIWLALLVIGCLAVAWLFPRTFTLAPSAWSIDRDEALRLVEARLPDLGERPANAYTTVTWVGDPDLELALLRSGIEDEELARRVAVWRVSLYEPGHRVGEWRILAEVSADGHLLSLLRGTPAGFQSVATLEAAAARRRAAELLDRLGVERAPLAEPTVRRVDLDRYVYTYVRYGTRRPLGIDHGVEVRFAGDELEGFYSWRVDPGAARRQQELRGVSLLRTLQLLLVFLLAPPVFLVFVRRYHQGTVGIRRALGVAATIAACAVLALALTARPAAESISLMSLTRRQTTWVWVAWMLVIYVPGIALLGFASTAVGESLCRGTWRQRVAPFVALFETAWRNSTVAASALRGVACGVLLAAGLLAAAAALETAGGRSLVTLSAAPWWQSASWPGVALLLIVAAFALAYTAFGQLFLLAPLTAAVGRWGAGGLAAVLVGLSFLPPIVVTPVSLSLPLWIGAAVVPVVLFFRYDLLTALLANVGSRVVLNAVPLVAANDASLELQGWVALLGSALPLWLSLPWLGGSRLFRWEYDDVPPHVRRIAERERQRVELETARRIQSSILPELPPSLGGCALAVRYVPATEIGGDFYDAIELEDGRLALAIGDVAGHGTSSGLMMSMVRSALAVQTRHDPEVEGVVEMLNRVVYNDGRGRLLTTLCYALLEPARRQLRFACAGHIHPYRVGRGRVEALESVAYPLGVRGDLALDVRTVTLDPGDVLVLITDGLIEARRLGGEEPFGFERLEASLQRASLRGAEDLLDAVLEDLGRFRASGRTAVGFDLGLDDDLTVLTVTLERPSEASRS